MEKKKLLIGLLCLSTAFTAWAARVDTVMVNSPSMQKEVKVVYVVPDKAIAGQPEKCVSVYLLHGYSGNAKSWVELKPELVDIADEKGMIFICPDGKNSWYWDSPKDPSYRYETFVSTELVAYTDTHYPTIRDRKARAISGLSMGGHGALWLSIRHKDTFGAVGSMSGGVDIRPFPDNWEMKVQLGEYDSNKEVWDSHTVATQLDKIENGDLAILVDCGVDDFFFEVNKELHKNLLERKIDHDFITRPGGHTGEYWKNSIDYHILFFDKFFNRK